MSKAFDTFTVTYGEAQTMGAVLSQSITPEATEAMDHEKAIKAKARLGKSHGNIARAMKEYDDQRDALSGKHTLKKGGKKVPETRKVKNEDGEIEEVETGRFKIADPDKYSAELKKLRDEEMEVQLSIIPLEWLEGNTQIGALCSACYMMIQDDE